MTNEEILEKAVNKAVENGWKSLPWDKDYASYVTDGFIFKHDFAKAFWGKEKLCSHCGKVYVNHGDCGVSFTEGKEAFKYHLQQMVLEEEPIKYLEQFLA